jgi:hypothetical protein
LRLLVCRLALLLVLHFQYAASSSPLQQFLLLLPSSTEPRLSLQLEPHS